MEFIQSIPYPLSVAAVFCFGLAIGSFANVCIYRLPKNESIVCVKSTIHPAALNKVIDSSNIEDTRIVFNPEFLREGSAVKDFLWPDRVVIGATSEKAFEMMREVYRPLYVNEKPMLHTNVPTAEMIKYASNSLFATMISFSNSSLFNISLVFELSISIISPLLNLM